MKDEQMRSLLCSLLHCGYRDLDVLDDCGYDMDDLIEDVRDMGYEKPDLNNIAYAMFYRAKMDLKNWVDNQIVNVKDEISDLEDCISDLEDEISDLEDEVDSIDTDIQLKFDEIDENKDSDNENVLREELKQLHAIHEEKRLENNAKEDKLENARKELELKQEEYEDLSYLDPVEDIESYHNYLDTSVSITDNEEIYEKYCSEGMKEFQENTGYSLT